MRNTVNRRKVLAAMSAGATVPVFAWFAPAAGAHSILALGKMTAPHSVLPAYIFFDAAEARFIEAACNRLIPPDASGHGALDAGVPRYLDAQLAGAWGSGERTYREGPWQPGTPANGQSLVVKPAELFRIAIRAIGCDLEPSGAPFDELPAAAQDTYLRSLESGATDLDGVPAAAFFDMLLAMTVEGYLSDPLHGGTREKVSWRMQPFPGAHAAVLSASVLMGNRAPRQKTARDIP